MPPKRPPYLRLVPPLTTAPKPISSTVKKRRPAKLSLQIPADIDPNGLIRDEYPRLGFNRRSHFHHPTSLSPYLQLEKDLDPTETFVDRLRSLDGIYWGIRKGISELYSEAILEKTTPDDLFTIHVPFGIRPLESLSAAETPEYIHQLFQEYKKDTIPNRQLDSLIISAQGDSFSILIRNIKDRIYQFCREETPKINILT